MDHRPAYLIAVAAMLVDGHVIHTPTKRLAVVRAIGQAARRLERPACADVLSDFRAGDGRTIRERLNALGETPARYLARLRFRESFDDRCRDAARLAFTYVGSTDVYVCGTQFWQAYQSNPAHVEALIIHEMMHTLGLGENPPPSAEITARVVQRCSS